ncbi:MAG: GumC domain-containing protein, partial [Planctomycetota bacterium]
MAGFAGWAVWPRTYHATFGLEILEEDGKDEETGPSGKAGRLRELLFAPKGNAVDEYIAFTRRLDVVEDALRLAGVIDSKTRPEVKGDYVYRLRKRIDIERDGESPLIIVYVNSDTPERAKKLAKGLLQAVEKAEEASRTERFRETLGKLEKTRNRKQKELQGKRSLERYFEEVDRVEKDVGDLRAQIELHRKKVEEDISTRHARRLALLERYTEDWYEVRAIDREIEYLRSFDDADAAPFTGELPDRLREWRFQYRALHDRVAERLVDFDGALVEAWDKAGTQFESLQDLKNQLALDQQKLDSLRRDIDRYNNSIVISAKRHKVIKEPEQPLHPSSPDNTKALAIVLVFAVA